MERTEWTSADSAAVRWLGRGEEAPDGQTPELGGGALLVGALAIEGTPASVRELLAQALIEVDRGEQAERRAAAQLRIVLEVEGRLAQTALDTLGAALGGAVEHHRSTGTVVLTIHAPAHPDDAHPDDDVRRVVGALQPINPDGYTELVDVSRFEP